MKRLPNWKIIGVLLAITGFVQGCVIYLPYSAKFQLVDAETRKPLPDVQGARYSRESLIIRIVILGGSKPGVFQLPPTDGRGMVIAKGLTDDLSHLFTFEKQGYFPAHVNGTGNDGQVGIDLPPSNPHHELQVRMVNVAHHVIVVPMYKTSVPIVSYEPTWREVGNPPAKLISVAEKAVREEWAGGGVTWKRDGCEVRSYQNQYGDYRVLFVKFFPRTNNYRVEMVGIIPPDDVSSFQSTNVCPATTTGPAVWDMPHWDEKR